MPPDPSTRTAEFDMLMARAGLTLSSKLRNDLLSGYAGLCEQTAMLRGSLTAADEPSNTFRLHPLAEA